MRYDSTTSSWRPWKWVRIHLTFTMRDIYISCNMNPLKEFTSNSRSTNFKYILLRNISRMIMETIPISTRIVVTYVMKWGIAFWVWWKVDGNWQNMIKVSQWRENHCRQDLVSQSFILGVKISKYISRWVDWKNLVCIRWNSTKNRA